MLIILSVDVFSMMQLSSLFGILAKYFLICTAAMYDNVSRSLSGRIAYLLATCEIIHCMINPHHFTEEPVKQSCRKNELPETDEMKSERNSPERFISLDSSDNPLSHVLRLEYRDDPGLYSIEHASINIIRSDSSDMH